MKNSAKVDGMSAEGPDGGAWKYFGHDHARSRLELWLGAVGAAKRRK
jgi:hypothetical protein